MANILGKPKDDEIIKEAAAKAIKKKAPLVPKWAIKKGLNKAQKNLNKKGIKL